MRTIFYASKSRITSMTLIHLKMKIVFLVHFVLFSWATLYPWANQVQSDQLYMAVLFLFFVKRDLSGAVYASVHVYTGQVTFSKVPE